MAWEKPLSILTFTAASDMDAATQQYIFVKFAAAEQTVLPCTAVADIPIGVLQNLPAQGRLAEVCVLGVTKVRVDTTDIAEVSTTSGFLGVSTSGRGVILGAPGVGAETTTYLLGRVVDVDNSNNDGALVTAYVNCINPGRHL